jgi:hypothetical protein
VPTCWFALERGLALSQRASRGGIAGALTPVMRIPMTAFAAIVLAATGCDVDPGPPDLAAAEGARLFGFLGSLADLPIVPARLPEDGGAYAYTLSMPAGNNMWKVTLAANLAGGACVDGSDPVFYVKAAPVWSAHKDDWIFFVPGGGSVQGADEAVAAYFGEDGDSAHGEMSSRWAPPSISPGGILDSTRLLNPFMAFNMVFIHKCSYDRYMGRRDAFIEPLLEFHGIDGVIPGGSPNEVSVPLDPGSTIELTFRGHDIVDAVIQTLATSTVIYDDGGGDQAMQSLATAESVLFIGHSGGGRGATMIIDDVAQKIRDYSPAARVRLVVDGAFDPGAESVVNGSTYPGTAYPTNDPATGANPLSYAAARWAGFAGAWQADGDATCLDNEANDGVCGDVLHVLMNWIETPLYVRQDLFDSGHATGRDSAGNNLPNCWQNGWDPDPDVCYGNTFDLADAVLDQVADLPRLPKEALTQTVLETELTPPSGFFPACGSHPGAHTDEGFEAVLTAANGVRGSYALGLWLWYRFPRSAILAVEATMPNTVPTACP